MTTVIENPCPYIIRFGAATIKNNSITNINFNPSFPTGCVAVIPYCKHLGFYEPSTISVDNVTKDGFQIFERASADPANMVVGWVAFGW